MSSQSNNRTTHVIFDYGGIIIDINIYLKNVLKPYSEQLDEQAFLSILSKSREVDANEDFKQTIHAELNLSRTISYEEFAQKFVNDARAMEVPLMPGIEKLLEHLFKNNIPMAIATNGCNEKIESLLKRTKGMDKYISPYVCGADDPEVKANKPAPDVYLVCAKRFDPAPKSLENCVIFEDSLRGITGAVNTGMKTVLINDQPIVNSDEIANKITVIVDSFDNFKPESVG